MINEEQLKKIAINYNAYLKGYDLFEFKKVKLLSKISKNDLDYYKFKVDNKNVSFTIKGEEIEDIKCVCFEKGVCKEVIASCLYLIHNDPKKKLEQLLKNKNSSISQ